MGDLLLRGMLVGLIAGVLAFGFARAFGEPEVGRAIAFEERMAEASGEAPEEEVVSRATQACLGLFAGVTVYGAAVGGLFALAFAFEHGRIGPVGPRGTAALVALAAFVAVVLAPDLKYPANPPSVGDPDTIGARTAQFFAMLAASVGALAGAVAVGRSLARRLGAWNAAIVAGLGYVAVMALVMAALPAIDEVPRQFSAVTLWRFRIASLGVHATLWTTIGLLFGWLAERRFSTARQTAILWARPL